MNYNLKIFKAAKESVLLESLSFGFLQDSSKDKSVMSLSEIEFCPYFTSFQLST